MAWALIENGIVKEIVSTDPIGRFASMMVWAPCDNTVRYGWTAHENGIDWIFQPPVVVAPKYNLRNWYWIVAGFTTQLWSSASKSWVAETDAALVAWKAAGGVPSTVATLDRLNNILSAGYVVGAPKSPSSERWTRQVGGYWFTPAAPGSVTILVATDPNSQSNIIAAYNMARDGHWVDGMQWKGTDGHDNDLRVPLMTADVITMALDIQGFISALFNHETELAAACLTDPTTDVTIGWPNNGTPPTP